MTGESGAQVRTRDLLVKAESPFTPIFTARAEKQGFVLIDVGDASSSYTLNQARSIDFDTSIMLLGAPSPEIEIDEDGKIVKKTNATLNGNTLQVGDLVGGGPIIVDDIHNDDTTAYGNVLFFIPSSSYDGSSDPNHRASASITGSPTVTLLTAFERVRVTNRSGNDLQINDIDVLAESLATPVGLQSNIVAKIGNAALPGFVPVSRIHTIPGDGDHRRQYHPGGGDITLFGVIDNDLGTTHIASAGGKHPRRYRCAHCQQWRTDSQ